MRPERALNAADVELMTALRDRGVISRRQRPDLVETIKRHQRHGSVVSVLPGVVAPSATAGDLVVKLAAVAAWRPDAVLTGAAAARLTFWPDIAVPTIEVAHPDLARVATPGYSFQRRRIDPDLVREVQGLSLTDPALTALDLCSTRGGDGIDRALRSRQADLASMRLAFALTPGRRGNRTRQQLLLDSRDNPWSGAEREMHQILRRAGIKGWTGNVRVVVDQTVFYLDIAFERVRLAIEIDGREVHSAADAFERDRWRQNLLQLDGWRILRFTWRMLVERPDEVVAMVRAALV